MNQEIDLNLERVPEPLHHPVEKYALRLKSLAGTGMRALILFGSAAAGTFDPKHDAARSVLVLEQVHLEVLRQLAKEGPGFGKLSIAAPLIMTPEYIRASLNTFPLEFLEIQQNHITVLGNDYFADLVLTEADMQHECERELKTILLGMRQALLASTGRDKVLAEIELDVGERMLRALRGMLWLRGDRSAKPALPALEAAEKQFGRALPGIRLAVQRSAPSGWEAFKALYADVEALGTNLDAW